MKKDPIDRLFEEKLKDYSEVPDHKVWKAIETSLNKRKKSRKGIPFWWKIAGAAAVLVLFLYLFQPIGDRPESEETITGTEQAKPTDNGQQPVDKPVETTPLPTNENAIVAVPEKDGTKSPSGATPVTKNGLNQAIFRDKNAEDGETLQHNLASARKNSEGAPAGQPQQLARAGNKNLPAPGKDGDRKDQQENAPPTETSELAQRLLDEGDAEKNKVPQASGRDDAVTGVANRTGPDIRTPVETDDAGEETGEAHPERKSLFEEIAEKEHAAVADNKASRWSVGPRVAPVYFSAFGQGSPIHSSFVSNSKSGNVNLSYGLTLSYALSPKLSIRSGIHKVAYGYDTNDISFSPTLAINSSQKINNIDYALSSRNLVVRNTSEAKAAQAALASEVAAQNPARDGRMVQQFGYVEVPVEVNLTLVDRKLGIHLIGGVSSLFLIDNSVTLESDGNATEMGEANNLNPLNFSTNLGVGVQYELSSSLQLNLEPVFKFQLNTFSDAAGDFSPYSIGVYSGLSFKF